LVHHSRNLTEGYEKMNTWAHRLEGERGRTRREIDAGTLKRKEGKPDIYKGEVSATGRNRGQALGRRRRKRPVCPQTPKTLL